MSRMMRVGWSVLLVALIGCSKPGSRKAEAPNQPYTPPAQAPAAVPAPQYQDVLVLEVTDDNRSIDNAPRWETTWVTYESITRSPKLIAEFEPGPQTYVNVSLSRNKQVLSRVTVPFSHASRRVEVRWVSDEEVFFDTGSASFRFSFMERLPVNYEPSEWMRVMYTDSPRGFLTPWYRSDVSNLGAMSFQTSNGFMQFAGVRVLDRDGAVVDRKFSSVEDGFKSLQVYKDLPEAFRFHVKAQERQRLVVSAYVYR